LDDLPRSARKLRWSASPPEQIERLSNTVGLDSSYPMSVRWQMIKEVRVFDSMVAIYKTRLQYLPRIVAF